MRSKRLRVTGYARPGDQRARGRHPRQCSCAARSPAARRARRARVVAASSRWCRRADLLLAADLAWARPTPARASPTTRLAAVFPPFLSVCDATPRRACAACRARGCASRESASPRRRADSWLTGPRGARLTRAADADVWFPALVAALVAGASCVTPRAAAVARRARGAGDLRAPATAGPSRRRGPATRRAAPRRRGGHARGTARGAARGHPRDLRAAAPVGPRGDAPLTERVERRFTLTPDERGCSAQRLRRARPPRGAAELRAPTTSCTRPSCRLRLGGLDALRARRRPRALRRHVEEHPRAHARARARARMHAELPAAAASLPRRRAGTSTSCSPGPLAPRARRGNGGPNPRPAARGRRPRGRRAGDAAVGRFLFGRARVMDFTGTSRAGTRLRSRALAGTSRASTWLARVGSTLTLAGCRARTRGRGRPARRRPRGPRRHALLGSPSAPA